MMEERGIGITISHANAFFVAEHGVALAMCLLRNLYDINDRIRKGEETRSAIAMRSLRNMNVGIMGYGHIGATIAELLKPYDVNIAVYTRGHVDGVRNCATPKELFASCDLVFNCLPLFDSTRNLIGYEELSQLKDRWLVNVSRAEIIEEEALYRALSEGILAGYAADVWYEEKWRYGDHYYDRFDNVIITPHCAANVADGRRRYMEDALRSALND
jgi:phosphoglycerate dehydrogenase-like enzyme